MTAVKKTMELDPEFDDYRRHDPESFEIVINHFDASPLGQLLKKNEEKGKNIDQAEAFGLMDNYFYRLGHPEYPANRATEEAVRYYFKSKLAFAEGYRTVLLLEALARASVFYFRADVFKNSNSAFETFYKWREIAPEKAARSVQMWAQNPFAEFKRVALQGYEALLRVCDHTADKQSGKPAPEEKLRDDLLKYDSLKLITRPRSAIFILNAMVARLFEPGPAADASDKKAIEQALETIDASTSMSKLLADW